MDFPRDVEIVLREIASQLYGNDVRPETVAELSLASVLPEHVVEIGHVSRSPKGTKPRTWPHYVLAIRGPRTDGRWSFRPGELAKLLKALRD